MLPPKIGDGVSAFNCGGVKPDGASVAAMVTRDAPLQTPSLRPWNADTFKPPEPDLETKVEEEATGAATATLITAEAAARAAMEERGRKRTTAGEKDLRTRKKKHQLRTKTVLRDWVRCVAEERDVRNAKEKEREREERT